MAIKIKTPGSDLSEDVSLLIYKVTYFYKFQLEGKVVIYNIKKQYGKLHIHQKVS